MKSDKKLDTFTKYILKEAKQEKPSIDFVSKVMESVKAENLYAYKKVDNPLISKTGWFFITVLVVRLCVFSFLYTSNNPTSYSTINFAFLNKIKLFNLFENIKFSNVFTFSFVFFATMVLIQLAVIKNYFNKHNSI